MPTNQKVQDPMSSGKPETAVLTNRFQFVNRVRPFLPEVVAVVLLFLAFVVGASLSPYFLDGPFLLDSTTLFTEEIGRAHV